MLPNLWFPVNLKIPSSLTHWVVPESNSVASHSLVIKEGSKEMNICLDWGHQRNLPVIITKSQVWCDRLEFTVKMEHIIQKAEFLLIMTLVPVFKGPLSSKAGYCTIPDVFLVYIKCLCACMCTLSTLNKISILQHRELWTRTTLTLFLQTYLFSWMICIIVTQT